MNIVEASLLSFYGLVTYKVVKYYALQYRSHLTHQRVNRALADFKEVIRKESSSGNLDKFYKRSPVEYIEYFLELLESFITFLEKEKGKLNSKESLKEVDALIKHLNSNKKVLLKDLEDHTSDVNDTYKLRKSKKTYSETFEW